MAEQTLTDEQILDGGWDARYTKILHVNEGGRVALVILDANGDGTQLYEEHWVKSDDVWEGASGVSAGDWDSLLLYASEPAQSGGLFAGFVGYIWGIAPGLEHVTVEWFKQHHRIPVDPLGIWSFVKEFPESSFDDEGDWGTKILRYRDELLDRY